MYVYFIQKQEQENCFGEVEDEWYQVCRIHNDGITEIEELCHKMQQVKDTIPQFKKAIIDATDLEMDYAPPIAVTSENKAKFDEIRKVTGSGQRFVYWHENPFADWIRKDWDSRGYDWNDEYSRIDELCIYPSETVILVSEFDGSIELWLEIIEEAKNYVRDRKREPN